MPVRTKHITKKLAITKKGLLNSIYTYLKPHILVEHDNPLFSANILRGALTVLV